MAGQYMVAWEDAKKGLGLRHGEAACEGHPQGGTEGTCMQGTEGRGGGTEGRGYACVQGTLDAAWAPSNGARPPTPAQVTMHLATPQRASPPLPLPHAPGRCSAR